ncbi:MAG: ethylbenzene dehydrogenase-related protein [Candidatus Omnitrophota bacterium]
MKKIVIIFLAIISILTFSLAVYYGFTHRRGVPVPAEEEERVALEAPFIDKEIDFSKEIDGSFWEELPGKKIKLLYQVMVLPWPKVITPEVTVKVFHNAGDIYFYFLWQDDTENKITGINKFSDACAAMFPLDEKTQTPTLMMGFLGRANIWHWKASRDKEYWQKPQEVEAYADFYYPFEDKETLVVSKEVVKSAVNDLISIRVGTVTPKETQDVQGRGFWNNGIWQVVMRRKLNAAEPHDDAGFVQGKKRLCAFAVWNGEKGDRGGRKSISDWVELVIK